jgi:hypothetical protein
MAAKFVDNDTTGGVKRPGGRQGRPPGLDDRL